MSGVGALSTASAHSTAAMSAALNRLHVRSAYSDTACTGVGAYGYAQVTSGESGLQSGCVKPATVVQANTVVSLCGEPRQPVAAEGRWLRQQQPPSWQGTQRADRNIRQGRSASKAHLEEGLVRVMEQPRECPDGIRGVLGRELLDLAGDLLRCPIQKRNACARLSNANQRSQQHNHQSTVLRRQAACSVADKQSMMRMPIP